MAQGYAFLSAGKVAHRSVDYNIPVDSWEEACQWRASVAGDVSGLVIKLRHPYSVGVGDPVRPSDCATTADWRAAQDHVFYASERVAL